MTSNWFFEFVKSILFQFFLVDEQLLQKSCFANFKLRGTLFSKIIPNFCRLHAISIHKIQQFFWNSLIFLIKSSYRVSHSKVNKVMLLLWGYEFWFLLIFLILCVSEIGPFMPHSWVFDEMTLHAIYGQIRKCLVL